jgi:hypothetical protein
MRRCAGICVPDFLMTGETLMPKPQDRIVYQLPDGSWANKRLAATRPADTHKTQQQAAAAAHRMIENQGGGELIIKGRNGQIRSKDTIPPGNDPKPPKDKEH